MSDVFRITFRFTHLVFCNPGPNFGPFAMAVSIRIRNHLPEFIGLDNEAFAYQVERKVC